MKRMMLTAPSVVLIALILGAAPIRAQQPGGTGMGPGGTVQGPMIVQGGPPIRGGMMGMMGRGCPMMGMMLEGTDVPTFVEGRIAFLKAELAITDPQQAAWSAYADVLGKNLQGMQGMRQLMKTALTGATPVERLDAHITAMEGRLAALKDVKPALSRLYEALGPDQKKKADELLTGMGCMM